jgi:hypothetical protein
MKMAQVIIIRPSFTAGLEWEITQIANDGLLGKSVFLLVDGYGFPYGMDNYNRFRETLEPLIGISLPEYGWNSWYVYFDENNFPQTISGENPLDANQELERKTEELVYLIEGVGLWHYTHSDRPSVDLEHSSAGPLKLRESKLCPACRRRIPVTTIMCRFCGYS